MHLWIGWKLYDECWTDLPNKIQDAYTLLGFNEDLWDNKGDSSTDDSDWSGLTDEQKVAALLIGYTEGIRPSYSESYSSNAKSYNPCSYTRAVSIARAKSYYP